MNRTYHSSLIKLPYKQDWPSETNSVAPDCHGQRFQSFCSKLLSCPDQRKNKTVFKHKQSASTSTDVGEAGGLTLEMNSPSASALTYNQGILHSIACSTADFQCTLDKMHWIPSLSIKQVGSANSLPGVQKLNNFKTEKGDGNHTSKYNKCNGLERLRDCFCYCSPSKGMQVQADFNVLPTLPQGTFVNLLYIHW